MSNCVYLLANGPLVWLVEPPDSGYTKEGNTDKGSLEHDLIVIRNRNCCASIACTFRLTSNSVDLLLKMVPTLADGAVALAFAEITGAMTDIVI